jgi:hypothetical protein
MAKEVNKVIYGGQTLIDLTSDTVAQDQVLSGVTFHDKSGAVLTGTCDYDSNTTDATASAGEILLNKTAYINKAKVTGTMANNGSQVNTITTKAQSVTIKNGFHDGSGKVSIDSAEQAKIIASNILEGVTILGVTGTLEPASDIKIEPSKTVTPYTTAQTILPSTGYDVMSQIEVSAIAYSEVENTAGGLTVTIGTVAPA